VAPHDAVHLVVGRVLTRQGKATLHFGELRVSQSRVGSVRNTLGKFIDKRFLSLVRELLHCFHKIGKLVCDGFVMREL
jgi:hypothetical protein